MAAKLFMVLSVLFVDLSPCFCQYGGEMMGGAMGEMMAGGMGGLGAMMSGGMNGLGGMMGGGGGGAGIGASIRSMAQQQALNSLNKAVHFIVGPQASPDQPLIAFAMSQGRPPTNMMQMAPYLSHMQRIAYATYGNWLAAQASTNTTQTGTGGTSLAQLKANLDNVILQKSVQYMSQPQNQQAGGGVNMAALGTMIPAMIQGIAGSYM